MNRHEPCSVTERWCKYIYDEQSLSYILHIQVEPMLQRAGFDHKHPHQMWAAHLSVDVSHLVGMLLPTLVQYEQEVALAFIQCSSFSDAQEQRLFVARGMYRALRMEMETFIRCAAARPRDAKGNILLNEEPLHKQFSAHNELFSNPFFDAAEFNKTVELIAAAECAEAANEAFPGASIAPTG